MTLRSELINYTHQKLYSSQQASHRAQRNC